MKRFYISTTILIPHDCHTEEEARSKADKLAFDLVVKAGIDEVHFSTVQVEEKK